MTVGVQVVLSMEMPDWLEAIGVITPEQWLYILECLNFTVRLGLH